ncbi:MAG TPA: hypothetical protein VIM38_04295 [Alphaproteobacteria bacterium]
MAPMRGEPQAAPKALTQMPSQVSSQVPSQAPAQLKSETQGQNQSEPPGAPAKQPPSPAQGEPSAGDRRPAAEEHRYSYHRVKDNFLRLDSRTGEVAQCDWNATGWSCKAVPDERAALESEIARLQRENAALKNSLLTRGFDLPGGVKPDAPAAEEHAPTAKAPEAAPAPKSPNAADLDRAIAFVKDVWRRLVEMMVDLQRDIQRKS